MRVCGCPCPGLSTGVLISSITVLLVSFLYGIYELLGLIYLFTFDLLSWFSLVTGLIGVLAAILALIGRDKEDQQILTWAFIWTVISLGCATIMSAFLLTFQAEASTTSETRALSILRIFSLYFFNVLLPLSWMAYELREFSVYLFHETDAQYFIRRKYDEEMDREVRELLPTTRTRTRTGETRWDGEGEGDGEESEKRAMVMELGRKRRKSGDSKSSRSMESGRRKSRRHSVASV